MTKMTRLEIQNSIIQAIQQLTEAQQLKLLEFIHSMLGKKKPQAANALVQFAGYFSKEDLAQMSAAIEDCEKIDTNEW